MTTFRDLDDMRREYGAHSYIGRLCSNRIEQTRNYENSDDPEQRKALKRFMRDADKHIALALVGA